MPTKGGERERERETHTCRRASFNTTKMTTMKMTACYRKRANEKANICRYNGPNEFKQHIAIGGLCSSSKRISVNFSRLIQFSSRKMCSQSLCWWFPTDYWFGLMMIKYLRNCFKLSIHGYSIYSGCICTSTYVFVCQAPVIPYKSICLVKLELGEVAWHNVRKSTSSTFEYGFGSVEVRNQLYRNCFTSILTWKREWCLL